AGQGDEDHRELAGARVDDVVLEGFQDPGHRAEPGAHHEVADLDPVDLDTGFPRAEQVAADRDRVQAPPGPGQDHLKDQDEDGSPDDLRPRLAAEPATQAQRLGRQVDLLGGGNRQRVAEDDVAGAERGDQRRDAEDGGDDAVDTPDDDGQDQDRDHDGEEGGDAGVDEEVHDVRRQHPDEPDRQVDLAADHQQHEADADDHVRSHVLGDVDEAAVADEGGGRRREVNEQHHGDGQDAGLALLQEHGGDAAEDARAAVPRGWGAEGLRAAFGSFTHVAHPNPALRPRPVFRHTQTPRRFTVARRHREPPRAC